MIAAIRGKGLLLPGWGRTGALDCDVVASRLVSCSNMTNLERYLG